MSELKILKDNIIIEPLVYKWHAWPYLIPPHCMAACMRRKYSRILRSFIESPQLHVQASQDPSWTGGPVVRLDADCVEQVKHLLDDMETSMQAAFQMDVALESLQARLNREASGMGLDHYYGQLPTELSGLVELVYEGNQPLVKLIEYLLYQNAYTDHGQQLALYEQDARDRPFVLSTPVIKSSCLYLDIPFQSDFVDQLAKAKIQPVDVSELASQMALTESQIELFKGMFETYQPHHVSHKTSPSFTYFNHACVMVQADGKTVLIDPLIGFGNDGEVTQKGFKDVPEVIDYVCITHNHQDHCVIETLLQLRHKIKHVIVPRVPAGKLYDPNMKSILERLGFENIIEIDPFQTVTDEIVEIQAFPFFGEHGDHAIASKSTYLVNVKGHKCLFLADACNLEPTFYQRVQPMIGSLDCLFIGMESEGAPQSWLYKSFAPVQLDRAQDQSRRLKGSNAAQANQLVEILNPKATYIYAMGLEPWLGYLLGLAPSEEMPQMIESNKCLAMLQNKGYLARRLYGSETVEFESFYQTCEVSI